MRRRRKSLEHLSGAQHDAGQRVIGDRDGEPGLLADALIEILDESAAAGEDNAAVADVGAEFGRGALERYADGVDEWWRCIRHSASRISPVVDGDGLGHAFDEVAALDLHGQRLVQRIGGAELDLDLLGGALADEQVIFPLQVIHDGFVHLVAGHADGARIDDAGERNDGDVGGAAADVHDHVAAGLGDGQAGADGRNHGLFDEEDLAGLGAVSRILDGALFDLRDFRRHADDDARMHQHLAVVGFLDEVIQHLLGDFEVGDDAVLHGLNRHDIAGRAAQHLFGFFAHRFHFAGVFVDGYDRRLVDDNALIGSENEGVGGAEIDGQVIGEDTEQRPQTVRPGGTRMKSIR